MRRIDDDTAGSRERSGFRRWLPAVFVTAVVAGVLAAAVSGFGLLIERIEPLSPAPPPQHAAVEIPIPAQTFEADLGEDRLNPFWHSQTQEELTEPLVQQYLYGMVKQKVIVPLYRVRYEMTQERIEWLAGGIEGRTDMRHGSMYLDILHRWGSGDFSRAVEDHNTLYRLMDGETGEAQRLATAAEEEEFIARFYR